MKKKVLVTCKTLLLSCVMVFAGCGSGDREETRSDAKGILSFQIALPGGSDTSVGIIDESNSRISLQIPSETDITSIAPEITISPGASIQPESGESVSFSGGAVYTVTAEDGSKAAYFVQLERVSNLNELSTFKIPDLFVEAAITDNTIAMEFPFGTDLSNVTVALSYSDLAESTIENGATIDLTAVNQLVVTSQTGIENVYEFDITVREQETGIRGVWLTNVASNVLASRESIAQAMQLLADLNFNTVFIVTWNKTQTPHQSQVLQDALRPLADPNIQTQFYPGRDVLQEVIDEAHSRGLKVIAWFEYGFASQFGGDGINKVLEAHPDWASRDAGGNLAVRNNFYWMNAFHPDVQRFLTDLILEVVNNYEVDGVQGDDRLPAVTSTSGYDDYTVNLYRSENAGTEPPTDAQDNAWVEWRANLLNDYAEDLYGKVKAADSNSIVSFSPGPFPFSLRNYLQDWPNWLDRGVVDLLSPQLYRRDTAGFNEYRVLFNTNFDHAERNTAIFYPGILLRTGNYVPSDEYLADVIQYHRSQNVQGEVYFFYEGVAQKRKVFEAMYPGPAIYPMFK